MPRPRKSVPVYSHHKARNLAYVRIPDGKGGRRVVYLGRWNSPESQAEYRRILAELEANPARPVLEPSRVAAVPVVDEVLAAFMRFALNHYRTPDGKPTGEITNYKRSLVPLRLLFGGTPATEFGPRALAAVRDRMIADKLCRPVVNSRIDRIKRVFKWAVAEEMIPPTIYQALRTLSGLRRGRTAAPDPEPIKPVDPAHVAATLPFLTRHVRAMVELMQWTGSRPGEVCVLRLCEVDRSGDVWTFRPRRHKTSHHGRNRTIHIGPRARAVLTAFLIGDKPPPSGWENIDLDNDETGRLVMADAYQEAGRDRDAAILREVGRPVILVAGCVVDPAAPVFSPKREREERFQTRRAKRKTAVQPSQVSRKKATAKRQPGEEYRTHALTHAIRVAAHKAGVPHWHPNQLRHTFATDVRKAHGLEAAGAVLGHAKMSVTEVYAERDVALAVRIAATMG